MDIEGTDILKSSGSLVSEPGDSGVQVAVNEEREEALIGFEDLGSDAYPTGKEFSRTELLAQSDL